MEAVAGDIPLRPAAVAIAHPLLPTAAEVVEEGTEDNAEGRR